MKLVVANLIKAYTRLASKLKDMTTLVAQKDAKITTLKAANLKGHKGESGNTEDLQIENVHMHARVKEMEAKVKDLTQQMLKNHAAENEKLTLLLRQLSTSKSGPSH